MGDDINNRETRFKFVRISNQDRLPQSTSPSDFVVDVTDSDLHKSTELYVHSVSFPNVFYNVDTHNNSLIFRAESLGGVTSVEPLITIEPGFYTTTTLLTALKTVMDDALIPVAGTIDFTQDAITNKISFQTTSLDGITFFSVDSKELSTLSPFLGINEDIIPIVTSGTFDAMPSLQGETMAYIHSKDISASKTRLSEKSLSVSSCISIPIDVPFLATQSYLPAQMETNKIIFNTQTDLATLNIRLRAQDGRILPLSPNEKLIIVLKMYYDYD